MNRLAPLRLTAARQAYVRSLAVERRQRVLIPGMGNRLFALAGLWAPGLAEWAMRKTLFEKLG